MRNKHLTLVAAAGIAAQAGLAGPALAQGAFSDGVIRLGLMSDMSGVYSDNCGPSSVAAVRIAVENFGGEINGTPIEVVYADDQNKPDIGITQAARWIEREGVDTIITCSLTPIVLSASGMMEKHQKPYMMAGSAATEATNSACNEFTMNWGYDTYVTPKAVVEAMMKEGLDTWFFITVDQTYGKLWEGDATRFLEAAGGKVLGSSKHPLNTTDFSTQLLEATVSGAKVIAIANSGSDMANLLKQAKEYQVAENGQRIAPLVMLLNGVHSIGPDAAQGLSFASLGYWDENDETRAIGEKFAEQLQGRYPNEFQIATYSAANHYLKAVSQAGTDEGKAVIAQMRNTPVNDAFTHDVPVREDGLVTRPLHVVKIKSPSEIDKPWAYYDLIGMLPADSVWRPVSESKCGRFGQ